jgi:type II secretory pathway component GspD/PulD (secretin)
MVSDERTNTLIVVGTEPAIEKIKTVISEIDVSVSDKNLEIKATEKQR